MKDLFNKLEEVGFLPVPNEKALYKRYGMLEVHIYDRSTAYLFEFDLFYYGTCYNYRESVSKKTMDGPMYWRSVQEILNYIDQGRAGQILIEALINRKPHKKHEISTKKIS